MGDVTIGQLNVLNIKGSKKLETAWAGDFFIQPTSGPVGPILLKPSTPNNPHNLTLLQIIGVSKLYKNGKKTVDHKY